MSKGCVYRNWNSRYVVIFMFWRYFLKKKNWYSSRYSKSQGERKTVFLNSWDNFAETSLYPTPTGWVSLWEVALCVNIVVLRALFKWELFLGMNFLQSITVNGHEPGLHLDQSRGSVPVMESLPNHCGQLGPQGQRRCTFLRQVHLFSKD